MIRRLLLLSAVVITAGCASYDAEELDMDRAMSYATRFDWPPQDTQFTMISHIPADAEHVEQYLGVNLLDYNILPVEMYFTSKDGAFEISAGECRFEATGPGDDEGFELVAAKDVQDLVGFSQWASVWGYLLIIPGPFMNMNIASANREMLEDYRSKELPQPLLHLSSGSKIRGVLFFRPKGYRALSQYDLKSGSVEIPVEPPTGQEFTAKVYFQ